MPMLAVVATAVCAVSLAAGLAARGRLAGRPVPAAIGAGAGPPHAWRSLAASALWPDRGTAMLAMWLMIVDTALALAAPWPLQFVVDYALGHKPLPIWLSGLRGLRPAQLAAASGAVGLLLLGAGAVAGYLVTFLTGVVSERTTLRLRASVLAHVLRAAPGAVARYPLGELASRIGPDVRQVTDTVGAMLEVVVPDGALLAGMTVITALVDWRLTAAVLCVLPLYILTARIRNRSLRPAQQRARARSGELAALSADQLARLRAVHVFDQADRELARHIGMARQSATMAVAALDAGAKFRPVTDILPGIGLAMVLVTGTIEVTSGHLSIGGLLVFLAYLSSLTGPVRSLAQLSGTVARGGASRDRIAELLQLAVLSPPGKPAVTRAAAPSYLRAPGPASQAGVRVQVQRVSFAHNNGRPVLEDFSAELASGEIVCLAGPSGTGKSTLLSLLVRLADPQSGRILFDGRDITSLPLPQLRRLVTLVPQDPWLHTGTIADNIRYGRPEATDTEVAAAAGHAGADTFTAFLPKGYDTEIGEHGTLLSGGQRRRIAIARALLRDTPILLLDEPTAGLDQATRHAVLGGLQTAAAGKTILIATHDPTARFITSRIIQLRHPTASQPAAAGMRA